MKTKKKNAEPRRPIREMFAAAARGKAVPISRLEAIAKKAGIKNFANRFYHFRNGGVKKLGMKAIYDAEKQTIRVVAGKKITGKKKTKGAKKSAPATHPVAA